MKGLLESPCSCCCSVTKSCPTLCDPSFLWTAACHASLSIRETSPWVCSNLCPLSQWCHPTISYSVALHPLSPPSPLALNFSSIRVSSNESALPIRQPKYWSFRFSISPSSEYSVLNSFRYFYSSTCRVHHEKPWAGGSTSWNQDCQKYQ